MGGREDVYLGTVGVIIGADRRPDESCNTLSDNNKLDRVDDTSIRGGCPSGPDNPIPPVEVVGTILLRTLGGAFRFPRHLCQFRLVMDH